MEKVITLRFAGKCVACNQAIPAGMRAVWLGKKNGVRHEDCRQDTNTNAPVAVKRKPEIVPFTVDFVTLRDEWQRVSHGDFSGIKNYNHPTCDSLLKWWTVTNPSEFGNVKWTGCNVQEMQGWIDAGYRVEGLQGMESLIPHRPRRKLKFAEEGDELLIDLAWQGVDEHFAEWEKRFQKPGLSVNVDMAYSARNPHSALKPYFIWVARMLQTLDENGLDVEVKVSNHSANLMASERESFTHVRVKRFGETADFASWSAMFSPGGYRMLLFLAKVLHGDSKGQYVNSSLGSPQTADKYGLEYDSEENVLHVKQANGGEFPEFQMTQELATVLQELTG